jgi:hypothetical protein
VPVLYLNANTAVGWASSVANVNAPTAAECTAATRLETLMPSDGLAIGITNNKTATGNLGSIFDLERIATVGASVKLKFHHDSVTDSAWTLLPFRTLGYLIVRRGLARATAFAAGQGNGGAQGTVMVLPLETGYADEIDPPANWDFELDCAMYADPGLRAVVA